MKRDFGLRITHYEITHFGWSSPSPHQFRAYLTDGPFLNQKHVRIFEYRIHRIINIKNKFLYVKINGSVG